MKIRKAELKDLSRIAEIFVFNNRINYFPIFHEEAYSFGEMQVVPMIDQYFKKEEILNRIYVYDDGTAAHASWVAGWLSFLYSSEVHHTVSFEFSSTTMYLSFGERPV